MADKIHKLLASVGAGSRRQVENWIRDGRITVNGRPAVIGERIGTHDKVCIDGRPIRLSARQLKSRVLLYHKPEGEMCTRKDPEGRPTIFDRLPLIRNSRWICVGRLDFNTSGLLLITNDGDLANKLMHPSTEIEREYAVRIRGQVSPAQFSLLQKGIPLEDGLAQCHKIEDAGGKGSNHWYHVTVKEGRNRLVRRLFEALDFSISRLIRIRFGVVYLPAHLKRGHHLELTHEEVADLAAFAKQKSEASCHPDISS